MNFQNPNKSSSKFLIFCAALICYFLLIASMGLWKIFESPLYFIPHDTHYPITEYSRDTFFNLINPISNYSFTLPSQFVWVFEIFILRFFLNSDNYAILNIIFIFSSLFFLFYFSFYSFSRITESFYLSIALTFCYCFTPFLATRYNTGTLYQISTCITLGLLPLLLHYLAFNKFNSKNIDTFFAFMAIYALGLFYIYPLLTVSLPLFLYFFLYKNTNYLSLNKKQILNLLVFSIPLLVVILYSYDLYMLIASFQQVIYYPPNIGKNGWAGHGSMLYPALQISAWGIYIPWYPMAIFAFKDFIMSPFYFFISSVVCISFISFGIIQRYYSLLLLLILSCFFAKGSAEPFGDIFNFIINDLPGGFLIRSPDSKYAALIAASYLILVAYLYKSRFFKYYFSVIILFSIINIFNIYYKGAIDNYYGDKTTSSFATEPESIIIAKLINKVSNAIVFTNLSECYSDTYDGKFHTCRGPLLALINKQVVSINSDNIKTYQNLYQNFNIIYLINKNIQNITINNQFDTDTIYHESEKYLLHIKKSSKTSCEINYFFSCYIDDNKYVLSIPMQAFNFYYPGLEYYLTDGLVSTTTLPHKFNYNKNDILNTMIFLSFIFFIAIIVRRTYKLT